MTFGGDGTSSVTATNPTASSTTITATDAPVSITSLFGSIDPLPLSAFLDLNLSSTSAAQVVFTAVGQTFSGKFSFTSLAGGGGVDYLSGTFADVVVGGGSGLTLTASDGAAGESVSLMSDVVPTTFLDMPRAISFSFVNVLPLVATIGAGAKATLAGFTSSVAGNVSASNANGPLAPVPEPSSIVLLGAAMLGVGVIRSKLLPRKSA